MSEEETIDISDLKIDPQLFQRFMNHLGKTVKHDNAIKKVVFLTGLSAYSNNPINLFVRGITSIGKSWNVTHALQYFPKESIWMLGGLSPTALVHEYGRLINMETGEEINFDNKPNRKDPDFWAKEDELGNPTNKPVFQKQRYQHAKEIWMELLSKSAYLVDLQDKLLVFLETPQIETYNKLRPILSHDKKEIEYRFTDRANNQKMRTNRVILRGWPATIFCSTEMEFKGDFATRGFTVTPEKTADKIGDVIEFKSEQKAHPWKFQNDEELQKLSLYLYDTKARYIIMGKPAIVLPYAEELGKHYPRTRARDMRDYDYITFLIEMLTILHLWQRPTLTIGETTYFLANMEDFCNAFKIWLDIGETTRAGLPGHIVEIFNEVIVPLSENGTFDMKTLVEKHNEIYTETLSSKTLYKYVKLLREIGWVDTEPHPTDKRKNLLSVLKNRKNILFYELKDFPPQFTLEKFKAWISEIKNYSPENTFLQIKNNFKELVSPSFNKKCDPLDSNPDILPIYKTNFSENIFLRYFKVELEAVSEKENGELSGEQKRISKNVIEGYFPLCWICKKPLPKKLKELSNVDGHPVHVSCRENFEEGRK